MDSWRRAGPITTGRAKARASPGGFRRCTARFPKPHEVQRLAERLAILRGVYERDAEAAKKLLAVGESKPDGRISPAELAAWTGVASLLLNLDETITKE